MTSRQTFNQRGFTLIELLVVVAVAAILAMVALPSYEDAVMRSRRAEAREALSDFAARQEQFFTDNKRYATTIAALGRSATTDNGHYSISVSAATLSYTLVATPQGPQADDSDCATLTLTWLGGRTPTDCW